MNSSGRLFRVSMFGESHGASVGVLIDGCPAGLRLAPAHFASDLKRRRPGLPGTTARRETDAPRIASGVLNGRTNGAPLLIVFENQDVRPDDYAAFGETPRPGHADFVALRKSGGFADLRGGGHFSGRLTVGLVAAGVVAKKLIAPVSVQAALVSAGGSKNVVEEVLAAQKAGDSIGGVVEARARCLPVGLGEPFFDSVESVLSHLVFAIPGVKGIEFGVGFASAAMRGSAYNDIFVSPKGKTKTNNSGGINGGLTNGNDLVFRVAVRPAASIARKQKTINLRTGRPATIAVGGRHDACIALRLPVIVEAATAIGLADLLLLEQRIPRIVRQEP
jgi:chorismate synthase